MDMQELHDFVAQIERFPVNPQVERYIVRTTTRRTPEQMRQEEAEATADEIWDRLGDFA